MSRPGPRLRGPGGRAVSGPLGLPRLHLVHGVEATAGGSATWLVVTGGLPVVAAYAPLARLALGRLVAP